jgi:hypothetical protein
MSKQAILQYYYRIDKYKRHGGRRTFPYAFTELGAVLLANVIRSKKADDVSVTVCVHLANS